VNQLKKIVGINLLIILLYSVLIRLYADTSNLYEAEFFILIISVYPVGIQVTINLLVSIVYFFKSNSDMGKAFLLSTIIVLLVGFSSCWGNVMLGEVL